MIAICVTAVRRPKPWRSLIRLEEQPVRLHLIPEHFRCFSRKELGTIAEQERRLSVGNWFSIGIHQHEVSEVDGRTGVLVRNGAALVLVAV